MYTCSRSYYEYRNLLHCKCENVLCGSTLNYTQAISVVYWLLILALQLYTHALHFLFSLREVPNLFFHFPKTHTLSLSLISNKKSYEPRPISTRLKKKKVDLTLLIISSSLKTS